MGIALIDIGALTTSVYALTYEAYKVDPRTAWAFVPLSAWCSFATYLNGESFLVSLSLPAYLLSPRYLERSVGSGSRMAAKWSDMCAFEKTRGSSYVTRGSEKRFP
jgi:hypothetical protein